MDKRKKYEYFIRHFSKEMPAATTELIYHTPYELLVAVVLSAQCTDKRINSITPSFFNRFPTPCVLARSSEEEIFPYLKTVSYPRSKTTYLLKTARLLVKKFGGVLPSSREDLELLPGVGRKTANVLLSVLYNRAVMPVDTHVMRVAKRVGLVSERAKTPLAIEKELTYYLAKKYLSIAHHWLILHGRYTCTARKPKCSICPLQNICSYAQKNLKNF